MREDIHQQLALRRMELGLSTRTLARMAGVTRGAVDRIEDGSADLGSWPLANVLAVLDALGLPAAFLDPTGDQTPPARLGAELARTGRITPDQLAGLDPDAAMALNAQLKPAGMVAVHDEDGSLALAPAGDLRPLERHVVADNERLVFTGLTDAEEQVVAAVASGDDLALNNATAAFKQALATLERAGLIQQTESGYAPDGALQQALAVT